MVASTSSGPVILVTGANKGLGLEVVHRLATKQPDATVLLGSRSIDNAKTAIEQLRKRDSSNKKLAKIEPLQIDVTNQQSIDNAKQHIEQQYGKLNTVINNSGVYVTATDVEAAKQTLAVNYYGVKHVTEALLPLIPQDGTGRIVIVSSQVGQASQYRTPESATMRQQLDHPEKLTVEDVDKLVEQYLAALASSDDSARKELPSPEHTYGSYGISKMFLSAYGRILARELKPSQRTVALVCPGFCATDLNNNTGARPAWLGAKSIVYGTTVDLEHTGRFSYDGKERPMVLSPADMSQIREELKDEIPRQERREKEGLDDY